jgi:hypothetical protein
MARQTPEQQVRRIRNAIRSWETFAPQTKFSRRSLEEFKAAMQPALAAHGRVLDQRRQLKISTVERNGAVRKAMEHVHMLGFAVKGHPDHGRDSALCEALGYTRETVRVMKIRRARKRKRVHPLSR